MNAHGVVGEVAHAAPQVRIVAGSDCALRDIGRELGFESGPAAGLDQPKDRHQQRAAPDQHKLQNLVEDRRAQPAQRHIGRHGQRRDDDGEVQVPAQHDLHHLRHGEHIHAAHQHGHEGEGKCGDDARSLAVAQLEVSGHGVRLADVVEGHHHHAQEEHGGDGAHPVPVRRKNAVLVGRAGPAHQFERAEVGRNKAQARDPRRHLASGHEKLFAGVGLALEIEADPDDHHEIDGDDREVQRAEVRQRRCAERKQVGQRQRSNVVHAVHDHGFEPLIRASSC